MTPSTRKEVINYLLTMGNRQGDAPQSGQRGRILIRCDSTLAIANIKDICDTSDRCLDRYTVRITVHCDCKDYCTL